MEEAPEITRRSLSRRRTMVETGYTSTSQRSWETPSEIC